MICDRARQWQEMKSISNMGFYLASLLLAVTLTHAKVFDTLCTLAHTNARMCAHMHNLFQFTLSISLLSLSLSLSLALSFFLSLCLCLSVSLSLSHTHKISLCFGPFGFRYHLLLCTAPYNSSTNSENLLMLRRRIQVHKVPHRPSLRKGTRHTYTHTHTNPSNPRT
jgi:hypothetical protein